MFKLKTFQLKITIFTGTLALLLVACIAFAKIQPALQDFTESYTVPTASVAGVAVGGTIEPTPTNTLFAKLQTQEEELNQKRLALDAEQRYLERHSHSQINLLYLIIGVLAALLLINLFFDIKRSRKVFNQEQHA